MNASTKKLTQNTLATLVLIVFFGLAAWRVVDMFNDARNSVNGESTLPHVDPSLRLNSSAQLSNKPLMDRETLNSEAAKIIGTPSTSRADR